MKQPIQTQRTATTLTSERPMASTGAELAVSLKTSFLKSHDRGEPVSPARTEGSREC